MKLNSYKRLRKHNTLVIFSINTSLNKYRTTAKKSTNPYQDAILGNSHLGEKKYKKTILSLIPNTTCKLLKSQNMWVLPTPSDL